jgi:predicted DNA-binding ribbon-helix-helix protein
LFAVSPLWCNVVNTRERAMNVKTGIEKKKARIQSTAAVRASISFPADIYETLDIIAKQKKVSLAWVVREAAEQYIGEKWPLFDRRGGEQQ